MEQQIAETWSIHNRIQLFHLAAIAPEALADRLDAKGRSVAGQFAHIHNVRLMWLKASAPELLEGLSKIEDDGSGTSDSLREALEASGNAITELLARAMASGGKIKSFKPHAVAFLGYLISHESYHMGKIDATLRQAGHPVSDKAHYGLWEWGVR